MKDERPTALKLTAIGGESFELPKAVVAEWVLYLYPDDSDREKVLKGSAITTVTDRVFCVRESCEEVARQYGECV
jgi:hypothetical protein